MRGLPHPAIVRAVVLACVVLAAACDDSTAPPEERVTAVQVAAGNMQEGVVGAALPQPVVIRAVDAQDRPVSGASVTWSITTGGGTIAPVSASATTDAEGRASATWTLGTGAGPQTATATIGMQSTTITATAVAGEAATVSITPSPVTLDAIGATQQLAIEAEDEHGNPIEGRTPAWTSSDAAVATVSAAGLVTAVSRGTATIEATLDDATAEVEVTVAPQPATIFLVPPTPELSAVGDTVRLQAVAQDRNGSEIELEPEDFTWSSSNPSVATVNASGLVTATGIGVTQIRATIGTVTGQAQLSVVQVPVTLSISPQVDTVTTVQPTAQFGVTGTDANGQLIVSPAVTWSSSNPAIATVTQSGLVTGLTNGTARIRVASGEVTDSATIVVRLDQAPVARADTIAVLMNTPKNVPAPGLLQNDSLGIPAASITSFGGGTLTGGATTNPAGSTVTFGSGGSIRVNADGSVAFTPGTGFTGNFTFLYRLQNTTGSSIVMVTIEVGVAPTAVDDSYATATNVTLDVAAPGLLTNDDRGFPLAAIASFGGGSLPPNTNAGTFAAGQRVGFSIGGFIRINADGSFSFTPPTGATGTFTFRYRLSNGVDTSDGTLSITVN